MKGTGGEGKNRGTLGDMKAGAGVQGQFRR